MRVQGLRASILLLAALLSVQPASAQRLIAVAGLDGQVIYINIAAIGSIRAPHDFSRKHLAPGTRCVVVMGNGDFVSTLDNCEAVRHRVDLAASLPHND